MTPSGSEACARTDWASSSPPGARHRPGTILGSLAVMLAGGGEHVSDLDILRTGAGVFGKVASNATVSRFFERTVASPDVCT